MVASRPHAGAGQPITVPMLKTPASKPHLEEEKDAVSKSQDLRDFIQEISEDIRELEDFYNIVSATRFRRLTEYVVQRLDELDVRFSHSFDDTSQQTQIDYLLLANFLRASHRRLEAEWKKFEELDPLLADWAYALADLCARRQKVIPTAGQDAAQVLSDACKAIDEISRKIESGSFRLRDRFAAFRGARHLERLLAHLQEWYDFYHGYDPVFSWWTGQPWEQLRTGLTAFVELIREQLVGIKRGDQDAIVGQPIGRSGILAEIEAEVLPYSPEQLIALAEREYEWCEREAMRAATEMGCGKDWRKAQEKVKNTYVEPGQQTYLVHQLAQEAIDYVEEHDLVTLPAIAKECWRTFMMSPEKQKVAPFFLGGPSILVSYPTDTMSHEDKLMVMRGNNPSFSRSTVFHEVLPGHHLQYHYMPRSKPYRQLFFTPFWTEGWAFYWEMILWDRGFPGTPEDKLGFLFWRMHRCARIVFSLKFHLGQMNPQECVDYLVDKVGHERATAEGEVRRSFNGDWGALYQAGYMLGALQLYALRKEVLAEGNMTEKEFHDRVMKENMMPIEWLRALLRKEKLEQQYQSRWKFYGDLSAV